MRAGPWVTAKATLGLTVGPGGTRGPTRCLASRSRAVPRLCISVRFLTRDLDADPRHRSFLHASGSPRRSRTLKEEPAPQSRGAGIAGHGVAGPRRRPEGNPAHPPWRLVPSFPSRPGGASFPLEVGTQPGRQGCLGAPCVALCCQSPAHE